jgi:GNAT superfamily N-acetyltransferase
MTAATTVRIEKANEQDVPLILEFIRELAAYERLAKAVVATEERLRQSLFGPTQFAEALIAYQAETPVGFAVYSFNFSSYQAAPSLYLEDIFVRPAYRGLGVGRQLFVFLALKALERGCTRLNLSVLNWNESAITFYKKLQAAPLTDWTTFRLEQPQLEALANQSRMS